MQALVTNLASRLEAYHPFNCPKSSVIVVESTASPSDTEIRQSGKQMIMSLADLKLNAPEETIFVYDGLINYFQVLANQRAVVIKINLRCPTLYRLEETPGLPFRTRLYLDRSPLRKIVAGQTILVDPGHGGRDGGVRGPINLWEKKVVLSIAQYLEDHLLELGAKPVLTRRDDRVVPQAERVALAARTRPAAAISLHTGQAPSPRARGVRTMHPPTAPSRDLAQAVHQAILKKMRLPDRRCTPQSGLPWPRQIPAAHIETVCLTNGLDEALLRSPVFKSRLARAIANGVVDYLSQIQRAQAKGGS